MVTKTLYQTLRHLDNDDEIIAKGPFECKDDNAWLGHGYYFWDTFKINAEWWGSSVRRFTKYVITKGICDYTESKCFDLVGNTEHLNITMEVIQHLKQKGYIMNEKTTFSKVIEFLKQSNALDNFEAIRAKGESVRKVESVYTFNIPFEDNKKSYLDLTPPIQICLFKKDSLNFRDYTIDEIKQK